MDGEKNIRLVSLLLRIGLLIVFLYAAIASFIEPDAWIGYFPIFLRKIFPTNLLLTGFSVVQILVGLWLLSGKKLFYAASFSALMLAGIVVFNLGVLDITFRDVGLIFSALALAALSYYRE